MRIRVEGCFFIPMLALPPRRPTVRSCGRHRSGGRAILLAVAVAACGPRLEPGVRPAPSPGTPTPADVDRPGAAPAFAYAPGSAVALVESRATIQVADDTSAASDTVVTTARVRWSIGERAPDGAALLAVVVDSFVVRAGDRVPTAVMPLPVLVDGTVRGGRVELGPAQPPPPMPPAMPPGPPGPLTPPLTPPGTPPGTLDSLPPAACEPATVVLGSVRDLFPTLPPRLAPGARWSDTVTTTTCRGGVHLVTTAVHRYTVIGAAERDGRPAMRLERASDVTVHGEGEQARERVTTDGRGLARATLHVDLAAGRLLDLAGESVIDLVFTGAGRTRTVVQQATTRVWMP